jgi:DNA-binding CsgD family transcriptional regulator
MPGSSMTSHEPVPIDLDLIEQIYDVSMGRSSWEEVLARLTLEFSSEATLLVAYGERPEQARRLALGGQAAGGGGRPWSQYTEHFAAIDPFAAAMREGKIPEAVVVAGDDVVPARQFYASEYYNDWFRPNGLRHTAGAYMPLGEGALVQLGLPRAPRAGRYTVGELARLQRYFNHINRALLVQDEIGVRTDPPDYDQVARDYGLTAAEARLVEGLARNGSLRRCAHDAHRSYHTLRAQLRAVFQKTGARSQIELMRLIHQGFSGSQPPPPRSR